MSRWWARWERLLASREQIMGWADDLAVWAHQTRAAALTAAEHARVVQEFIEAESERGKLLGDARADLVDRLAVYRQDARARVRVDVEPLVVVPKLRGRSPRH